MTKLTDVSLYPEDLINGFAILDAILVPSEQPVESMLLAYGDKLSIGFENRINLNDPI